MTMIEHLRRLFAYDDWANREVLTSLRAAATPPARPLKLLAHIFSAERLWWERLQGEKQTLPVWPDFTLEQCAAQAAELAVLWEKYLSENAEPDLAASVSYKNSKGENWSSRKEDILFHVMLHSAYHRGQIATATRAAGLTPAYTDFIHSVRQGFIE